jgi:transcriptional regulator with XRE-family HTH domain
VKDSIDLRKILSINIRTARETLHITQARLAEYADISLPYMTDIEYCKTWVSDKTLLRIAKALNMEVYELLMPPELVSGSDVQGSPLGADKKGATPDDKALLMHQIAELIDERRIKLRKETDETMKDLLSQIIRLYSE